MNWFLLVLFFSFGIVTVISDGCTRPDDLKEKEEYCWKKEVEIIDRIQQTSKNVLNFAKKKLGISFENKTEDQKCEYYMCIFQQLKIFNSNGYPVYQNAMSWIEDHVTLHQAKELIAQYEKCNAGLANSTQTKESFYADDIISNSELLDEDSIKEPDAAIKSSKPQSRCEIAKQFMKCLAHQEGACPVFVYP